MDPIPACLSWIPSCGLSWTRPFQLVIKAHREIIFWWLLHGLLCICHGEKLCRFSIGIMLENEMPALNYGYTLLRSNELQLSCGWTLDKLCWTPVDSYIWFLLSFALPYFWGSLRGYVDYRAFGEVVGSSLPARFGGGRLDWLPRS